ncbi:heme A synthase [Pseudactinotalea sp. HY160]|uniref:COX15/CtaA family protein n=1 Tax=Pseudactinotalea sp. HY160 TaxID=2654490 RepID=UPI00351AD33F
MSESLPPAPAGRLTGPTGPAGSAGPLDPAPRGWVPGVRLITGLLIANLVMQLAIIVTGGAVRLTGSGLGCSTWPQCEPGRMTPVFHGEATFHPYVEFGNRVVSVVVVLVAIAAFLAVWTHRRTRSRGMVWLAFVPVLLVLVQAGMGAITVIANLNPAIVGFHFFFSAMLVWVSTWALVRWRRGDGPMRSVAASPVPVLAGAMSLLTAIIVTLGVVVTGAGPHSGDADVGYRFALDPLLVTRAHSGSVWLFVGVAILYASALRRQRRADPDLAEAYRALRWVALAVLVQGGIGYWQYFTGLPEILVGLHLLGSGLVIAAVTNAVLRLRRPTEHRNAARRPA